MHFNLKNRTSQTMYTIHAVPSFLVISKHIKTNYYNRK